MQVFWQYYQYSDKMVRDVFAKPEISLPEIILLFAFSIGVGAIGFAVVDYVLHDLYVLPSIETCYKGNDELFCQNLAKRLGVTEITDQLQIGRAYWDIQFGLVFVTGTFLAIFRFASGFLAGSRSIMLFIVSGAWFVGAVIPYFTGYIDTFYYVLRGIDIPDRLPWLNEAGLFEYVKVFGNPNVVESFEVILLNIIGFFMLVLLVFWLHQHHKRGHFDRWLD